MTKKSADKSDEKNTSQDGNPFLGYLVFSGLCILAFVFDVPLAIIVIAILGYAFSRYSG